MLDFFRVPHVWVNSGLSSMYTSSRRGWRARAERLGAHADGASGVLSIRWTGVVVVGVVVVVVDEAEGGATGARALFARARDEGGVDAETVSWMDAEPAGGDGGDFDRVEGGIGGGGCEDVALRQPWRESRAAVTASTEIPDGQAHVLSRRRALVDAAERRLCGFRRAVALVQGARCLGSRSIVSSASGVDAAAATSRERFRRIRDRLRRECGPKIDDFLRALVAAEPPCPPCAAP